MYTTIPQLFRHITGKFPDTAVQYSKNRKGTFIPVSFSELYRQVTIFAAGLYSLGVRRGDNLGLIADNRKEWLVADLAVISLGAVDVPRGRDSMAQEIGFILGFSDCRVVFAENRDMLEKIVSSAEMNPRMEKLIVLDQEFDKSADVQIPDGILLYTYGDVVAAGKELITREPDLIEKSIDQGTEDDVITIIFTSGTTGEPKGVMLTNRAYLHQVTGVPKIVDIQPGDIWLSVLPVWHSFERVVQYVAIGTASALAYSKPIGKIMLQDFQAVKPQWMASVPRIWESVRAGVFRSVQTKPPGKPSAVSFFCLGWK